MRRHMWGAVLVGALMTSCAGGQAPVPQPSEVTTVVLVRHAEKVDSSEDPDISEAGRARARTLADMFREAGVAGLYATQYKRTQQTLQPLSDELGLPIQTIHSDADDDLIGNIRANQRGKVVLVAGHSNSVPRVIGKLGAEGIDPIPETEYDNLFVVTLVGEAQARVLRMKYGP